jgi:ankyrin repeat protein
MSLLHDAVRRGENAEARLLVARGLNINEQENTKYGTTPLQLAKDYQMAELLLSMGADPNAVDKQGEGALVNARGNLSDSDSAKNLEKVRLLLSKGADVNSRTKDGSTSLVLCICDYQVELLKLLLANGADVQARDNRGRTPLYYLAYSFATAKDPRKGYFSSTASEFYYAKLRTILELLLGNGAMVGAPDNEGNYPLHVAAEYGCVEMADILLQRGAEINAKNNFDETPLAIATRDNRSEMITFLKSKSSTVEVPAEEPNSGQQGRESQPFPPLTKEEETKIFGEAMALYKESQPARQGPDSLTFATMDSSKLRSAYKVFRALLDRSPNHVEALIMEATCILELFEKREYDRGRASAEKAVALDPTSPKAQDVYGRLASWICYDRGDKVEASKIAIASMNRVLELDPHYSHAFGTSTAQGGCSNVQYRQELRNKENSHKRFLLEEQVALDADQSRKTAGDTPPLPTFGVQSTPDLENAISLMFDKALPAIPLASESQAKLDCVKANDTEINIEGSESEVRDKARRILKRLALNQTVDRYEIRNESNQSRVNVHFSYGGTTALLLWRTSSKVLGFSRHPELTREMAAAEERRKQNDEAERLRLEAQMRAEEEKQKVKERERIAVMRERATRNECVQCGRPLTLLGRLFGRTSHRSCLSYLP